MSKYLRYYGEFVSVEGHINRVALYQDADTPFEPQQLDFPYESPLVIEWSEKDKTDVILGSTATLKIISPSDRKFLDLYSVKYGTIRMDVWRDGEFYWSGCIDPEFYEEPYEMLKDYTVSLTFSDFNILERLKFDMSIGFKDIKSIIAMAVYKTQCVRTSITSDFNDDFEFSNWVQNISWSTLPLSTTDDQGNEIVRTAYVRTDNFFDEDGTAKTWSEVITAILQPLGVHVIQRRGMLYLYDYDALVKGETTDEIYWTSDSQTLAIDKVYNNIKITWSPYAQSLDLLPSEVWPDDVETPATTYALDYYDGKTVGNSLIFTYPLPYDFSPLYVDSKDPGFTLWTSATFKNIDAWKSGARAFKTVPQWDGDESEGMAVYWRSHYSYETSEGKFGAASKEFGKNPISTWGGAPTNFILVTKKAYIPPQSATHPLQLRVSMECLVDCKINPFEEPFGWLPDANTGTISSAMGVLNARAQFLYIPVQICFQPHNSSIVYYYTNESLITGKKTTTGFAETKKQGRWSPHVSGMSVDRPYTYLAYYLVDSDQRQESTALCKWTANRQAVYLTKSNLQTIMQKIEDGQYIDFPSADIAPGGGDIWIQVGADHWWVARCNATTGSADHNYYTQRVKENLTFALLKMPTIDILNNNLFAMDVATNDVVYEAEVEPDAKEELELNTICGSYVDGLPTARGLYFKQNGTPISQFTRAGRTAPVEELLCGTLFSQYCGRKIALVGECRLGIDRHLLFTEPNQGTRKFIASSESQDLRADTNDAKFIETIIDIYDKQ